MMTSPPGPALPSFPATASAPANAADSPLGHLGEGLLARISDLAREVEERALGGSRARVLILPGLPGTSLGIPGRFIDDTVWLDPASVLRGRLTELSITQGPSSIAALHAIPEIYFQLKLRLLAAGYDVDFYPFDWRRSVLDLGREFAEHVRREGREVHVVAHSFGGLVARSALLHGAENLGKIVMLGTPNHGTFSTIQGIRGDHWLIRSLSAFDTEHTSAELGAVFATFPSIYEQLPTRRALPNLDIYAPTSWPRSGLHPDHALLARAPAIQEALAPVRAPVRGQLFVIAGHGRTTIDGVEVRDDAFHYRRSTDGDGWVPTSFVELERVPTYYTTAAHIGMTNSRLVLDATVDLLDRGGTDHLPQSRPLRVARPGTTEAQPTAPRFGGRTGIDLTADDIHSLVGQLFAEDPPDADD
jgi:pimeloyl-ACP methyl ester carboxylesterase